MITIRPSSFTRFIDCERAALANTFTDLVNGKGFDLYNGGTGIAATIGTCAHKGAEVCINEKTTDVEYCFDFACNEYNNIENSEKIFFDKETRNKKEALQKIKIIIAVFISEVYPDLGQISFCEKRFIAKIDSSFELAGTPDIISKDGILYDLKTGKRDKYAGAQYGAYVILLRHHGIKITSIKEIRIPCPKTVAEIPSHYVVNYDVSACTHSAIYIAKAYKEKLSQFMKKGNFNVFLANPASELCSKSFCCACKTSFCPESHFKNR